MFYKILKKNPTIINILIIKQFQIGNEFVIVNYFSVNVQNIKKKY